MIHKPRIKINSSYLVLELNNSFRQFCILNLETFGVILFNMNMKNMVLLTVCLALVTASASASTFMTDIPSIELMAYEKGKSAAEFKVISTTGFEKELEIVDLPEWLSCQPKAFLINRSKTPAIEVVADASNLKPGVHSADIMIKTANKKDAPEKFLLPVTFTIIPEKDKPTATPRSLDIKPGLVRVVMVNNPSNFPLTLDVKSLGFWIQTYPETIDVPANSSNLFWAKMTATHFAGGTYPSVIKLSNDFTTLEVPVRAIVTSGVEFNPESIGQSGPITMTNKLKNSVIVKPVKMDGVEFSFESASIAPGKSKIVNVKFTGEKKPDYISFAIVNGTNMAHNVKVDK